jgi:hypothetical protein
LTVVLRSTPSGGLINPSGVSTPCSSINSIARGVERLPALFVGRADLQCRDDFAVTFHIRDRQLSRLAAISATNGLRPEMLTERPIERRT